MAERVDEANAVTADGSSAVTANDANAVTANAANAANADELRNVRPQVDRLRMETARERAEKQLFGSAAPARLGRYVLLGGSADGGMGIVYAADDPELHRKVALKVLHPRQQWDEDAHDRLITEARALARLDHPNVVKVHDVITRSDQVVIVMEWVEGETVEAWESEQSRSWREVVAVYAQAGQGLAATHGVGVVHRDFKPSNVIVGDDGRVRVLDLGLARPAEPGGGSSAQGADTGPHAEAVAAPQMWAANLTATGVMVGTLAYAAPEQLAGEVATPASDQFSFGVSLHRALEGVSPFEGDDAKTRIASIQSGRIATAADGRVVPRWLRAIVARSLAADPAARFPSMPALLRELIRPRGWRRWRIPLVVGACIAVAALALITRPEADPLAGCEAGPKDAARFWDEKRAAVDAALVKAITTPDAGEVRARVLRGVDGYRDHWIELSRGACTAHLQGQESDSLFDRRMLCLQQRLGDLRATVGVLDKLDAGSARNAVDIVMRMPGLAECSDAESLQAEIAPPPIAARAAVEDARRRVSSAMALDRAGRSQEAIDAATKAVDTAERSGYPPVEAEAELALGRMFVEREDFAPAIAVFARARAVALEHRRFAVAVEAAARAIYAETRGKFDLNTIRRDAEYLLPLSKGLPRNQVARPLLLNNLGTAYMAAGERGEATWYFRDAHAALDGVAAPDLELTMIDKNLAMVTRDASAREALARGVCERLGRELGESHLMTLDARQSYARYLLDRRASYTQISEVCDDYRRLYPELIWQRVQCEGYRAFLAGELGARDEERQRYEQIVALAGGATDLELAPYVTLAAGYARLLGGDGRGAVAELQKVAVTDARSRDWWERARAAHAELGLGLAERGLGHGSDAIDHLERAIALYEDVITRNEETEYGYRMALARRTLDALRAHQAASGRSRQRHASDGAR